MPNLGQQKLLATRLAPVYSDFYPVVLGGGRSERSKRASGFEMSFGQGVNLRAAASSRAMLKQAEATTGRELFLDRASGVL